MRINYSRFALLFFIQILCSVISYAQNPGKTIYKYILWPGYEVTVAPGTTLHLSVDYIDVNNYDILPHAAVGVLPEWNIDGHDLNHQDYSEGKFTSNLSSGGDFTAPNAVPAHNPITITATFNASENPLDSTEGKTKIILICTITIQDAPNFFFISPGTGAQIQGKLYKIKEPILITNRKMAEFGIWANNVWNFQVNGVDSQGHMLGFAIMVDGNGAGTYSWRITWSENTGVVPPGNTVSVFNTAPLFTYVSFDCVPHGDKNCHVVTLTGTTTITTFDIKNKIARGFFTGQLEQNSNFVFVSGGFTVFIR